jgi:hypothetical protein
MNKLVVHIHNKHTYMASMNQLTKMAVDQSCNRFQISLIRYLGLSHQQLPYFISLFKRLLKLTFYFHQHFHLLCSIVHSDDSYDAEEEQQDQDEEVSVYNEKENARQPVTSHLQLRVLENGEEILESDDSVGEVRGETLTEVPWDVRVRILTICFRSISKYYQRPKTIWNQDVRYSLSSV